MNKYPIGSLVNFRDRAWVVMPSKDENILHLRPLTGQGEEECALYLPYEKDYVTSAEFPLPTIDDIGDVQSARLLRDAARLLLRHGAGPFRSMGHLSFRPRPYQFVPLLMALRLDNVRMLIADDVGVGKTIEAGLIARELLDTGESKRLAILCPPYLCDQWHRELRAKFNISSEIIRTNTIARLERALPRENVSIFEYYPNIIVSIDFIKSRRYKEAFIEFCPDLLIVDEAHNCARPAGVSISQQQRHQLLHDLSKISKKKIILVTATPHSGIEEAFLSLLGILNPSFESFDLESLSDKQRAELAKHFIQRRRADVEQWLETVTPFPERVAQEEAYRLTIDYSELLRDIYEFARELVKPDYESGSRRRVKYWAALALLRCVMSSPAAAKAALLTRLEKSAGDDESGKPDYTPYILDPLESESALDIVPSHAISDANEELSQAERRKLKQFYERADKLIGNYDSKIKCAEEIVRKQLKAGYKPIIFCRYIATADYVRDELRDRLKEHFRNLHIISVTGELSEDEREQRVAELCKSPTRVLVATDCLSEGINLQEGFDSVIHYDLPWNPNRLEQREGRVDRFGQKAKKVRAVILYGADNPIDGAVLDVLLRKARHIHKSLGISVPIPADSEAVMETVLKALFLRSKEAMQMSLFEESDELNEIHKKWDRAADKEKKSRTRFAQHAIKPDEVAAEIDKTDKILGDPKVLETFIRTSCQRLGANMANNNGVWVVQTSNLPETVRSKLSTDDKVNIVFDQAAQVEAEYICRNHPAVATLASHLFDTSLRRDKENTISTRCDVLRSEIVDEMTVLLVLRVRYLLKSSLSEVPTLAEECIVTGYRGMIGDEVWLSKEEAEHLLDTVEPSVNMQEGEKKHWAKEVIDNISKLDDNIKNIVNKRSDELLQAHSTLRKVLKSGKVTIAPLLPADILALSIVLPKPAEKLGILADSLKKTQSESKVAGNETSDPSSIKIGDSVDVLDLGDNQKYTYRLECGPVTPVERALIGKHLSSEFEVDSFTGKRTLRIIKIC
jgi:superfamily II DNA or RNA helicase